jgi:hypothetical protein
MRGWQAWSPGIGAPRSIAILAIVAAPLLACAPAATQPPTSQPVLSIAVPATGGASEVPDDPEEKPSELPDDAIRGMGDIYIGQKVDEVRRLLGPEDSSATADDERSAWQSSGYEPEEGLIFLIGFDHVLVYESPKTDANFPFWKIYTRDNRVVFIILTSYGFETMSLDRVGFPPSCFMLGDEKGIAATFGSRFLLVKDDEHGHETYHYLDRGISVITSEGQIRVFDIYGPVDPDDRERVRRAISPSAAKNPPKKP